MLGRVLDHVFVEALLVENAAVYDLETNDLCAFLEDVDRRRGHRTRENATNVRVVPAGSGEEDDLV